MVHCSILQIDAACEAFEYEEVVVMLVHARMLPNAGLEGTSGWGKNDVVRYLD